MELLDTWMRWHEMAQLWNRMDIVYLPMEPPQCTPMNRSQGMCRYDFVLLSHTCSTVLSFTHPTQGVQKDSEGLERDPVDRRDRSKHRVWPKVFRIGLIC